MRLLVSFCLTSVCFAADAPPDRVREAAGKAVALTQVSQKNWVGKESCFPCHHQSLPPLAFSLCQGTRHCGDEAAARASAERDFTLFSNLDRAVQYTHVIDPAVNESYLMVGGEAVGLRPNLVTAVYARLIAGRQKADGHWETSDVRPPQSYSTVTATATALRRYQALPPPEPGRRNEGASVARPWLARFPTPGSNCSN